MPTIKNWKNKQLQMLRADSEHLFDRLCSEFGLPSVCQPLLDPNIHVQDEPDNVVITAHLPGMTADDVGVYVDRNVLVVRCEQHAACAIASRSSLFEQRFRLPCRVRTEEVTAVMDGESLVITMPKCRRPIVRQIPITQKR